MSRLEKCACGSVIRVTTYPDGDSGRCLNCGRRWGYGDQDYSKEEWTKLWDASHPHSKEESGGECSCIVPDGRIVCDNCGKHIPSKCANCGEKMGEEWECPSCGTV